MARDGSSGGVIRMACIDKSGVERQVSSCSVFCSSVLIAESHRPQLLARQVFKGDEVPSFWEK